MATWWVNQGSKKGKPQNSTVWAPDTNKRGNKQWHWETMWEANVGDKIYHYTDGFIVGVSHVLESAKPAANPYPNNAMWEKQGKILTVDFELFKTPIPKSKIPVDIRTNAIGKEGPFNIRGDVQQGYFFPVSIALEAAIEDLNKLN